MIVLLFSMDISYRDYRIQENLKALREPMRVFMSRVQLFRENIVRNG